MESGGDDLEVWLLEIGLSREIIVITGSQNKFTFARRFPCRPPPIPKVRGGIFIAVYLISGNATVFILYLSYTMALLITTQHLD